MAARASRAPTQSEEAAAAAISSHHSKPGSSPASARRPRRPLVELVLDRGEAQGVVQRLRFAAEAGLAQQRAAGGLVGGQLAQRRAAGLDQLASGSRRPRGRGVGVVVDVGGIGVEGDLEGAVQAKAVGERVLGGALGDAVEVVEHQLVGDEAAGDRRPLRRRGEDGEGGEALGVGALVVVGGERVGAQQRIGDRLGAGEQAALGGAGGGEDPQPVAAGGAGEEADASRGGRSDLGGRGARRPRSSIADAAAAQDRSWSGSGAGAKW